MKMLYIAHIRVPSEWAHVVQIMKMCEAFAEQGIEIELVVPNRYSSIKENPFSYFAVKPIFKITKLSNLSNPSNQLAHIWSLISFSIRACIYAKIQKPDIVYGRDEGLLFFLSFFYKNLVWEAHGWKWNLRVRRLSKKLRFIISITEAAKNRYIKSGVNPHKILVAPDGIDDSFLNSEINPTNARKKLGLPLDVQIVMYVGLLNEWKGFQTLASCADKLADKNVKIVLVGGTTEKLKKEFSKIIFLGYIPYKELSMVQSAADILVIPNSAKSVVSTDYTSPLKLFAHMASGRPIIASNLPSLREILNEETAYFFKPDSPEDLAETIKYVLDHKEEANKKAQEALSKVKEYTWNKRADRILKFINI